MPLSAMEFKKHRARVVSFVSRMEWAQNQPRNTEYRDLKPLTLQWGKGPPNARLVALISAVMAVPRGFSSPSDFSTSQIPSNAHNLLFSRLVPVHDLRIAMPFKTHISLSALECVFLVWLGILFFALRRKPGRIYDSRLWSKFLLTILVMLLVSCRGDMTITSDSEICAFHYCLTLRVIRMIEYIYCSPQYSYPSFTIVLPEQKA